MNKHNFNVGDTVIRTVESHDPSRFGIVGTEYVVLDVPYAGAIEVINQWSSTAGYFELVPRCTKQLVENTTAYGLLSKEMQDAFAESAGPIEVYTKLGAWTEVVKTYAGHRIGGDGIWKQGSVFKLLPNRVYRLVTKPVVKPSIDWSQIDPKFQYLAVDGDGDAFIYEAKPTYQAWGGKTEGIWIENGGDEARVNFMSSYKPGNNCPSKGALVKRPKT